MRVFLFAVLVGAVWALPAHRNPMENPGMFEGDMLLGFNFTTDRNAVPLDSQRWPNGVVPYVLDKSLDSGLRYAYGLSVQIPSNAGAYWGSVMSIPYWSDLKAGMDHISQRACITFVKRTTEHDYIKMFVGDGCYAHWGKIGGEQSLSLGTGCYSLGIVIHELLHAIGFEHEHNRSDRDDHLIIYWDNIETEWHFAFYKLTPQQNRLLTPFDFDSIMLYGQKSFAKSGNVNSMVARNNRFMKEVYDKPGMSTSDVTRVKMLYNC